MMKTTLLFIVACIHASVALKCLDCNDIPDPKYCRVSKTCSADESCTVEEVVKADGSVTFNLGCFKTSLCSAAGNRRNIADVTTCLKCCADSDYCNVEGCGKSLAPPANRGPFCLTCDSVSSPDQCNSVHQCPQGDECFISFNNLRYRLACEPTATCSSLSGDCNSDGACCTTDFCNSKCGNTPVVGPTTGSGTCDTTGGYIEVSDGTTSTSMCVNIHNDQRLNWDAARAACQAEGGDLVVMDTHDKAILIRNAVNPYTHLSYWIGMKDFDSSDTYKWVNDQPVVFSESDWHHGQPNFFDANHVQDCGIMWASSGSHHQWHDDRCDKEENFICERIGASSAQIG